MRLEENPLPGGIRGPFREMLLAVGPEMPFSRRLVLGNLWLFGPLVERQLSKVPATDSMMRTSTAVTIIDGGVKSNVLPSSATAVVNFRIAPGDSVESVLEHVRRVIADPRVSVVEARETREPSPVSPTDSEAYRLIERTIRQAYPEAIIAPPTAESVKDMSSLTRQVLDKLGTMLKEAPALQPSDTRPQNRAEAPASPPAQTASEAQPSVASATPGASPAEASPEPATPTPVATGNQTGAPLPQ